MNEKLMNNKLYKYQLLIEETEIKDHNPVTYIFSKDHLLNMLERYNEIIIKPKSGFGGRDVRKVTKLGDKKFKIHHKDKEYLFRKGKHSLYHYLKKIEGYQRSSFIIQNCISLAKVNNRPIDLRYIVQRKKSTNNWVITGKHAKVAGKGYFITNLQNGAEILPVEKALSKVKIKDFHLPAALQELDRITLLATRCLSKHFKDHTIWGYDMAVDTSGHVWIIEANSSPSIRSFRYLGDLSMYETIVSFQQCNNTQ